MGFENRISNSKIEFSKFDPVVIAKISNFEKKNPPREGGALPRRLPRRQPRALGGCWEPPREGGGPPWESFSQGSLRAWVAAGEA